MRLSVGCLSCCLSLRRVLLLSGLTLRSWSIVCGVSRCISRASSIVILVFPFVVRAASFVLLDSGGCFFLFIGLFILICVLGNHRLRYFRLFCFSLCSWFLVIVGIIVPWGRHLFLFLSLRSVFLLPFIVIFSIISVLYRRLVIIRITILTLSGSQEGCDSRFWLFSLFLLDNLVTRLTIFVLFVCALRWFCFGWLFWT